MASNCILNSGLALQCRNGNVGGVKTVYMSTAPNSGATYTVDADDVITGMSGNNQFYTFEMNQEVGSFNAGVGAVSVENGTSFFTSNLDVFFPSLDAEKRDLVYLLAASELSIIVRTNSDKYFIMKNANMVSSDASAGRLFGDRNGLQMVFESKEIKNSQELDSSVITALAPTV